MKFRETNDNVKTKIQNRKRFLPHKIFQAGVATLPIEAASRVIVINTLCFSSAILAGCFSFIIFYHSFDYGVLVAGLLETLLFSGLIVLNHRQKNQIAAISYLLIHNIALFYFAVVRGMVAEERLLWIFLLLCSVLVLGPVRQIVGSILISTGILAFGRINQEYQFLLTSPLEPDASSDFHELGTIALAMLILIEVFLFRWLYQKFINELRRRNETLEEAVRSRTSELKAANVKLEATNANLKVVNANLEKANANIKFFYDQFSHDLRDILNSLFLLNEMVRQLAIKLPGQIAFFADRQQIAISGLMDMVVDILNLRMIESGKFDTIVDQTIDTQAWLEKLVSLAQVNADPRQVSIHLSPDPDLPAYIVTDPVKLGKIVNNLLTNAVKHTDIDVFFKVFANDQYIMLEIRDKGQGIAKEHLPHIFDKNYSTGEGNGLGLYIVHWLSTLMNIELLVDSIVGWGTKFRLKVPFALGKREDVRSEAIVQVGPDLSGRRILIADDSFDVRFVLKKNLQAAGSIVLEAKDGKELLKVARRNPVDLILMDNRMPEMGGLQALELLRSDDALRKIPVILMTASSSELAVLEADADDYLFKPLNIGQLLRSIGRLLNLHPYNPG